MVAQATSQYSEMLDFALARTRDNLAKLTSFPEIAKDGRWHCVDNGGWVGGHWVGLLWLAFVHSGDHTFEAAARGWAARLAVRQHDTTTHDMGFLFELSHALGAQISGDDFLKTPAINASKALIQRFNKKGKYIQAWGAISDPPDRRGRTIIDAMMNLDMLYWASKETGDPVFAQIATDHARTALARQVRPDWSTAHVMDFNPDTGEFLRRRRTRD